jgi:hypothetical protein
MRGSGQGAQYSDGPSVHPGPGDDSLGGRLSALIAYMPADTVTLSEIRDLLGHEGLLLLIVVLSIVFLIPVSIPGVSTVFGAAVLLIALSRLLNRTLWLPRRFLERQLPAGRISGSLEKGLRWVHRLEGISRSHRLEWFVSGPFVRVLNDCALILGAVLLMAPFGLVPLSNTLPALAIILFAIGSLQHDGVCVCLGHAVNVATMIYFSLLLGGGGLAIYEVFHRLSGGGS